ncbi:hypothetical protein FI667_g5775, partial [Globisporangium splendens]
MLLAMLPTAAETSSPELLLADTNHNAISDGYMCAACGYSVLQNHPEDLIECHYCALWFHRVCVRVAPQLLKFACYACSKQGGAPSDAFLSSPHDAVKTMDDTTMTTTGFYDPSPEFSLRYPTPTVSISSSAQNAHTTGSSSPMRLHKKHTDEFRAVLTSGFFSKDGVRTLQAQDFPPSFFQTHPVACEDPIVVQHNSHGVAGLHEPFPALGVVEITALLAQNVCMRSVDVESQESFNLSSSGWNARLGDQKTTPVNAQFRVAGTRFERQVAAPHAVSEVDWHYSVPSQKASSKVPQQQVVTMNPDLFGAYFGTNSFQDFTIAPGGKCAWLSVSDGDAWVYLIPPTAHNLRTFQHWRRSPERTRVFLAQQVDQCIQCVVSKASTLFIPAGWISAIFSPHACSFYMGFFSMTVSVCSQVRVLETLDAAMTRDTRYPQQRQQELLAIGWPLDDAVPQLWAALCGYVRKFLIPDPSVHVREEEKHALARALPYLRRWSASSPQAITASDGVSWTPASVGEAHDILDRLEQALSSTVMLLGNADQRYAMEMSMNPASNSRSPQQMDAAYMYARGDPDASMGWSGGPEHGNATSVGFVNDLHAMWGYDQPSSSQQAYYQQPSEYASSSQHPQYTFSLGSYQTGSLGAPATSDPYMESMRQQLFSSGTTMPTSSHHQQQQLQHSHHSHHSATSPSYSDQLVRHRASCHRCGNLRKKNVRCPQCPHIFCQKCAEKMLEEHGDTIFVDGCPVCKEQCCCGKNRTMLCSRKYHCYKKCPSTKKPSS